MNFNYSLIIFGLSFILINYSINAELTTIVNCEKMTDVDCADTFVLNESAERSGDDIILINSDNQRATVWYQNPVRLFEEGFTVEFQFVLTGFETWWICCATEGGTGLAFVVQTYGTTAIGDPGEQRGWRKVTPTESDNDASAVEFMNIDGGEIANSISYWSKAVRLQTFSLVPLDLNLRTEDSIYNVVITYEADTRTLTTKINGGVAASREFNGYADLKNLLDGGSRAYIGFAAGSTNAYQNHVIKNFKLSGGFSEVNIEDDADFVRIDPAEIVGWLPDWAQNNLIIIITTGGTLVLILVLVVLYRRILTPSSDSSDSSLDRKPKKGSFAGLGTLTPQMKTGQPAALEDRKTQEERAARLNEKYTDEQLLADTDSEATLNSADAPKFYPNQPLITAKGPLGGANIDDFESSVALQGGDPNQTVKMTTGEGQQILRANFGIAAEKRPSEGSRRKKSGKRSAGERGGKKSGGSKGSRGNRSGGGSDGSRRRSSGSRRKKRNQTQ